MIPYLPTRVMTGVLTALIALCYTPEREVRAQASSKRGRQVRAASRLARSQPKEENEKAREIMEEGLRRADQKEWAQAFEAFNQALALSPRYGDAYIAIGDTYMSMGKYAESFKAYRQAISVEPSNPDAYYSLGAAYNYMAQYGDSFKYFVQAINLDPDFAEAHYGIGYAYFKLENFKDALVYLRRASRLEPNYWEAHLALGKTYLGLQDVKAAEGELKILAGLDATAASNLEKEIRKALGTAKLPDRTERDGPSESAPPPREKSVTTNTAQEQSADRPVRPATQTQSGDSRLAVELSFWESIKNSGSSEEFAAYLNKYPEGQFAELARIRMRALASKKGEASGEKTVPKQPITDDNTAAPSNLSKPIPQTPAYDAVTQQPKEQLSEEQPVKDQSVKEKEQPQEQPLAEKPKSNETGDVADAMTVDAALDSLRRLLPSRFSYEVRAAGEASVGEAVTVEVNINYEPLKFEGCAIEWRDQNDVLRVSLPELDPEAVRVELRSRPGATFSIKVWNVSMSAASGKGAISEVKGDGSGTVNRYNGLDLQYDDKEKAERLARSLRQAIKLCVGKP